MATLVNLPGGVWSETMSCWGAGRSAGLHRWVLTLPTSGDATQQGPVTSGLHKGTVT